MLSPPPYTAAMAKADPQTINATFHSARMAHQAGNLQEAEGGYRRVLAMNPRHAEAMHHLGLIAAGAGMFSDAIELFERAVGLAPKAIAPQLDLARAHREIGHPQDAIKAFRRALKLAPNEAIVLAQLADLLHQTGEHEEALSLVDQALEHKPGVVQLMAIKASVLDAMEQKKQAEAVCREAFAKAQEAGAPVPLMIETSFARIAPGLGLADEAVGRLNTVLEQEGLRTEARTAVLFAIARIEQERGNHERAFELYTQANSASPGQWSADTHAASIDALIGVYSPERVASMPRSRQTGEGPVFVIGMPGSGTALVQQALCTHPEVGSFGQPIDLWDAARRLSRETRTQYMTPQFMDAATSKLLDNAAIRYATRSRSQARSASRVIDALPTNFFNLGLIAQLLPGAKVIRCVRQPLDACWAAFTAGNQPFAHNLSDLGRYAHDQQRLTDHFVGVLDLPVHTLDYEAMVADPVQQCRAAIEFLGLDPDRLDADALGEVFGRIAGSQRPGCSEPYQALLGDLKSAMEPVASAG